MPIFCYVDGCETIARAKGLCKTHYQRNLEYGRFDKVLTGDKTKHSLYRMWNKRKQIKGSFVEAWLDFDIFIKDVGIKPDNCFLARLDENKPCGPTNFEWRKIKLSMIKGETLAQYGSRRSKEALKLNPDLGRISNYKHKFGLTLDQIETKLKSQNYVCAICEQPEKAVHKLTGKIKTLSLDHNHSTGKIRDFLCAECNLFAGKVEKDRSKISKTEKYLDRWQLQHDQFVS